jgi:NAD-dependent deacetylase
MANEQVIQAAKALLDAQRIVVFTGAGISTESGIPDFRSPGGVWSRYNQEDLTYQRFRSHEKYRKLYWKYDNERYPAMRDAEPNAAHRAVVQIEKMGKLQALITQNIDGLHHKAGNSDSKILEIHGTVRKITCLECNHEWPREEITEEMDRLGIEVPYCTYCGGPLKCATISFGQSLSQDILQASFEHAATCDLFLTIGSSLVVQPANLLPVEAKRNGAYLILVNMTETSYDGMMDLVIRDKAGSGMESIMSEVKKASCG